MRAALYLSRATVGRCWRAAVAVALISGLLGAVALGALAGARRTASAYSRYLIASNTSDVLISVPGILPGVPHTRPVELISRLPGITRSAGILGLAASPVFHGHVDSTFLTNGLIGSYSGEHFTGGFFGQDRLTVLAGRMPRLSATGEIALTPQLAGRFGVWVGGRVTYFFDNTYSPAGTRSIKRTYRVTAIVEIPPVLVDRADQQDAGVLPPGATRQLLAYYSYSGVGVRLDRGAAGIPGLQHHLAVLASAFERQAGRATHQNRTGLSFEITRSDVIQGRVQQAIRPQAVALAVFGVIAALALLVLAGQALAQILSRSGPDAEVARALGGSRAQVAMAAGLPGAVAIAAGVVLAVAGAVALSPLAPVGQVRRFDPAHGAAVDGLVLGAGSVLLAAALAGLLAVMTWRAVRPSAGPEISRPSLVVRAAASAGLPAFAVIGSRNALEGGSAQRPVPVRAALAGSVAAVAAVTAAVVFGTSLTGLTTHPDRYGWNWDLLIQAEGGYGTFTPQVMSRLVGSQPAVAAWSSLAFSQLPVDGRVIPVLGLQRQRGSVEPPTTSGQPITGDGQIELGALTLRELGRKIGDTVLVGVRPYRRPLTIVGTVTLPSFGEAAADHVSLGRGALLSQQALLASLGLSADRAQPVTQESRTPVSAVAIDLAPGTSAAQRAQLVREIVSANPDETPGGTYELSRSRALAEAVADAAQMGGQPLALAIGLAVAALLSLALIVLASVRRRRRELALVKTLGMTRPQVQGIIAWQATLTLVIAIVVGAPLGIAAGRWAWRAFAGSLGVAPVTVVPAALLAAGGAVLIVAGNLLAFGPAAVAARTPPAAALRAE